MSKIGKFLVKNCEKMSFFRWKFDFFTKSYKNLKKNTEKSSSRHKKCSFLMKNGSKTQKNYQFFYIFPALAI